jgi:hypothetical protein
MRKILLVLTVFLLVLSILPITGVHAEGETPSVVDTTIPVDAVLIDDINVWLASNAPAPYPYWAITYAGEPDALEDTFVSLVAIDVTDPNAKWYMEDRHPEDGVDESVVRWMGSVIVHSNHSVSVFSDGGYSKDMQARRNILKLAMPVFLPPKDGGGSNVRFPWEFGKSMMYGTRGIHAAGGGGAYAIGFSAVDFLALQVIAFSRSPLVK